MKLWMDEETAKHELGKITLVAERIMQERNSHRESPRYELTPAEEKEAREYLESARLFENLKDDLALLGLEGKEAVAAYLACTSRLTENPLHVTSPCVALIETISSLFPKESAFVQDCLSPKALSYMGDQALENSMVAVTGDRLTDEICSLLRKGSLKALTVEKDKDLNAPRVLPRTIGAAPMFFLNQESTDEEARAHCLNLRSKVTGGIAQARTEEGYLARARGEEVRTKHQNVQRYLKRLPVINGYARKLEFSSPNRMSRELYLRLIDSVCLLRQCQKELDHLEDGQVVLRVDTEDIAIANGLARELFKSYELDDLQSNVREKFTILCHELSKQKKKKFTRAEYRRITGCGMTTSKNHLDKLLAAELVFTRKETGKAAVYTLGVSWPLKVGAIVLTEAEETGGVTYS